MGKKSLWPQRTTEENVEPGTHCYLYPNIPFRGVERLIESKERPLGPLVENSLGFFNFRDEVSVSLGNMAPVQPSQGG